MEVPMNKRAGSKKSRGGASLMLVGATTALGVIFTAFYAMLTPSLPQPQPPTPPAQGGANPSAQTRLLATCVRAGITPEALLAAGVAPSQFAAVASASREYANGHSTQLAALDRAANSTSAAQGTEAQTARTQRDAMLTALFDSATSSLSAEQREALRAIHRNSKWRLPVKYSVIDRTEEEWVALREALADTRIAARSGREPSNSARSLVQAIDANASVAAAGQRVSGGVASTTEAWKQALHNAVQ